jgi:hypothetical protein
MGWDGLEGIISIAQLRRQRPDIEAGWSVGGGWFDDGSLFFALRSDSGPSSKRAVQLCARCDRATNEARSNLLSLVLQDGRVGRGTGGKGKGKMKMTNREGYKKR